MLGDYFRYPKTGGGGCAFQIKVARDRENIFHFELDVINKFDYFIWLFFSYVSFLLYSTEIKGLSAQC